MIFAVDECKCWPRKFLSPLSVKQDRRIAGPTPISDPYWKVVIYEGERSVRTEREHITYHMATKIARELSFQFGAK